MKRVVYTLIAVFVIAMGFDIFNYEPPSKFTIDGFVYHPITIQGTNDTILVREKLKNRVLLVKLDRRYCNDTYDYNIQLSQENYGKAIQYNSGKLIYLDTTFQQPFIAFEKLKRGNYFLKMKDRTTTRYQDFPIKINTKYQSISTNFIRENYRKNTRMSVNALSETVATHPNMEKLINYHKDSCLQLSFRVYDYTSRYLEVYNPQNNHINEYALDSSTMLKISTLEDTLSSFQSDCSGNTLETLDFYSLGQKRSYSSPCYNGYVKAKLEDIVKDLNSK